MDRMIPVYRKVESRILFIEVFSKMSKPLFERRSSYYSISKTQTFSIKNRNDTECGKIYSSPNGWAISLGVDLGFDSFYTSKIEDKSTEFIFFQTNLELSTQIHLSDNPHEQYLCFSFFSCFHQHIVSTTQLRHRLSMNRVCMRNISKGRYLRWKENLFSHTNMKMSRK